MEVEMRMTHAAVSRRKNFLRFPDFGMIVATHHLARKNGVWHDFCYEVFGMIFATKKPAGKAGSFKES